MEKLHREQLLALEIAMEEQRVRYTHEVESLRTELQNERERVQASEKVAQENHEGMEKLHREQLLLLK
ncbi:hypothetical protein DPX39_110130100 [Trypanosoma brucei equiperdum]|uniref:Uncharacterized protein n=1 Tax=Trypanosoma brucei equiperdum TaxID=630700 RepID=A0A3L6KWZ3_9TRYP|nr:hypothetical protein DPX39_110130100 [Trypanosoma brucei equiperdum]